INGLKFCGKQNSSKQIGRLSVNTEELRHYRASLTSSVGLAGNRFLWAACKIADIKLRIG
ncbi:TPA: hypothetical protein ACKNY9_000110, partial [Neisseria gonorrhoeae]